MKNFEIYEIKTKQGIIYTKQYLEEKNGISFPSKIMHECFTDEECEFEFNYIKFNKSNKYLEYADLIVEDDGEMMVEPFDLRTITLEEFRCVLIANKFKGINLQEEAIKNIQNGISKTEATSQLKAKTKKLNEKQKIIKEEKALDTFYKVFGDLFEDNIPTR